MAKIVISKRPDERRDMYSVNTWAIIANGVEIGKVYRENRPRQSGRKRFEAITHEPLFKYQRIGAAPSLERRKRFDTLVLLRDYLSRMPVIDRMTQKS